MVTKANTLFNKNILIHNHEHEIEEIKKEI